MASSEKLLNDPCEEFSAYKVWKIEFAATLVDFLEGEISGRISEFSKTDES